jgi:5-methylcytosine-specific restriction enzyme subunit McrC
VYDDHTADTPLNRLVRAALVRCSRMIGIDPAWRRRLAMQLHEFDDVADGADLEWARRWTPAPMERHYATAASLARWILQGGGAADRHGADPVSSFLLDMNQLFEDFVTRAVAAALPHMDVTAQARQPLGRDGAVMMKPDIEIARDGRTIAVADCKYKILDDELARSPDYYQMLAYATSYGLDEARLLYARGPSDLVLRDVAVRNSPIRLRTLSFDLTAPVADVRNAIGRAAMLLCDADGRRPVPTLVGPAAPAEHARRIAGVLPRARLAALIDQVGVRTGSQT